MSLFNFIKNLFKKSPNTLIDSDMDSPEDDFDITWKQDSDGELKPSWEFEDNDTED